VHTSAVRKLGLDDEGVLELIAVVDLSGGNSASGLSVTSNSFMLPPMFEVLGVLLGLLRTSLRCREDLVLETLLLRHQLAVLARSTRRRPAIRRRDKLVWILSRRLCRDWRRHLVLVRPETVVARHRRGWRLFWWWRSHRPVGRPRLSPEVRELIATMSGDNPRWGAERIRGELLKPGIVVSKRSIRRYRWRAAPRPPSQTWRTFLANHHPQIWAADLLTVPTLSFRTLYVLLFVSHGRRELIHVNVTSNPTAAWIWRQLVQATPWGRAPQFLIRDRDRVYGSDFPARAARLGIRTVLTPVRAPRANAVAERLVGTLRRECFDHLIVVNERHLRAVLAEFARYYNAARPHRALDLETPQPACRPQQGPIRASPVLGGLHHVYERTA
jgi:putative transposase